MNNCVLTVVIPSYQEEENLRILLPRLNKVLDSIKLNREIIEKSGNVTAVVFFSVKL